MVENPALRQDAEQIADELLVLDAQAGDGSAFEGLVRRWQPKLWRHARLLSDDDASARDAVQESWSAVIRGLRGLDDPAHFGPWLLRIVTNKCADSLRARARRRGLVRRVLSDAGPASAVAAASADDEHGPIRAAVASLPEALGAAVSLHYGCGLSVAHVALVLAIPIGTVKSRLSEARARIRVLVERSEHEHV